MKRVAQSFRENDIFVSQDPYIIFVCGGTKKHCVRHKFCRYAEKELPHLRIFLAENAQKDYVTHRTPELINVAEFEGLIGELSDCTIIFPESPGSLAELGYFSSHKVIRKTLLVANDINLQAEDSFISLGPISLIDKYSRFGPTLQIAYKGNPVPFHFIKERLNKRLPPRQKRKKFDFKAYSELSAKEKFFIVLHIVNTFQVVSIEGMDFVFKSIFGHSSKEDIKRFISMLVAAKYVRRSEINDTYFQPSNEARAFIEMEKSKLDALRLDIFDFYAKHDAEASAIIGARR